MIVIGESPLPAREGIMPAGPRAPAGMQTAETSA